MWVFNKRIDFWDEKLFKNCRHPEKLQSGLPNEVSIEIQNKQIPSAHSTSIGATLPFDSHRTLLGSGLEVLGSFFLAAEVVDFLAVGLLTCPSASAPKYKKMYRLFFLRSIAQFFTQIYMICFVSS